MIARSSVHGYAGKTAKPQEVGRDLGVRYVLDGSVRKSGDRLRINANLVEAENAQQVWAEQYDRQLTDIFALQDEVIGHIVSALAIELTAVEEKQIARVPTANLEAYDYYLRAEQAARLVSGRNYGKRCSYTRRPSLSIQPSLKHLLPMPGPRLMSCEMTMTMCWRRQSPASGLMSMPAGRWT